MLVICLQGILKIPFIYDYIMFICPITFEPGKMGGGGGLCIKNGSNY